MAGDWIKIREDLHEDLAVLAMAEKLGTRPEHVVGYCCRFWSWVSRNCHDGKLTGVSILSAETVLNLPGFLTLLAEVGWLEVEKGDRNGHAKASLVIPKFERHLSESAKRRALNAEHQRQKRQQSVSNLSAFKADKTGTREEKRRVLAPALGGVAWAAARDKANSISKIHGRCTAARDRRLVLAIAALSQNSALGSEWLEIGLRETKDAKADKPYAYLHSVLRASAEKRGFDFLELLATLDIPEKLLAVPKVKNVKQQ